MVLLNGGAPAETPEDALRLRAAIENLSDQLCPAVDGMFDIAVKVDSDDVTVGKLQMLVNFVIDAARRGLTELEAKVEELESASRALAESNAELQNEIVQREQIERTLRVREAKFSAILESALDPTFMIDSRGIIQHASRSVEQCFGWNPAELVGRNIKLLIPEPHRSQHDRYLADYLRTGQEYVLGSVRQLEAVCRDGTIFPCELCIWRIDVAADSEPLFVGAIRDVTLHKQAEDELREAKRAAEAADRSKSEFLANMSHEIRTPMTAILGFSDVLTGRVTDPESVDAIEIIRRNGEHLLEIINGILDLSKIEAGKVEIEQIDCSICRLVADVASLMRVRADAKGLTLDIEFSGPIPESIRTDPTRLRQILINLIGNAVKFTETGGVRLVTGMLHADGSEPKMQFSVIDTGIGMSDEAMANVFRPFTQADTSTTRQFGGTGLGLSIGKRLAGILGGDIAVSSTPGEGSTFSLSVATGPCDGVRTLQNPAESILAPRRSSRIPSHSEMDLDCRILLAEDGPDNQRLIAFILKKAGAEVTVAENGQVAVDQARAAELCGEPFDLILMDMQMPVLDGYQATRQLRREGYARPIIALTAHAMQGDRQKCFDAGCDDYATKPIDRHALIGMIAAHVTQAEVTQ